MNKLKPWATPSLESGKKFVKIRKWESQRQRERHREEGKKEWMRFQETGYTLHDCHLLLQSVIHLPLTEQSLCALILGIKEMRGPQILQTSLWLIKWRVRSSSSYWLHCSPCIYSRLLFGKKSWEQRFSGLFSATCPLHNLFLFR